MLFPKKSFVTEENHILFAFSDPGLAPRSTAARVIAGFWWLVVLLFFVYYVLNLAPFLKSQGSSSSSINSFEDLAKQSKVQPLTLANGSTATFLKVREILLSFFTSHLKRFNCFLCMLLQTVLCNVFFYLDGQIRRLRNNL